MILTVEDLVNWERGDLWQVETEDGTFVCSESPKAEEFASPIKEIWFLKNCTIVERRTSDFVGEEVSIKMIDFNFEVIS